MPFQYQSMLRPEILDKLHTLLTKKFYYQDIQDKKYRATLPVGFERELCVQVNSETGDETLIYNNYDHPLNKPDQEIIIGQLNEDPKILINNYINAVKKHRLDEENHQREEIIYKLRRSDLVAFDWLPTY